MTTERATTVENREKPRYTVKHWEAFWDNPDAARVGGVLTPDVVGDWPGDPEPVRGLEAYRERIAQLLALVPDFRARAIEHAVNGDLIFIRWIARATGANGPFEIDGIDRIRLEDGLVKETIIRYDSATFEARLHGNTPAV